MSIGEPIELRAGDGIPLTARCFDSAHAEMTVLMLPGIGVPQRAFRHIATWLSEREVRCLTIDYRGIGESNTEEGVESATLLTWARLDAVAALECAEQSWQEPVFLLGHSFGGQILGIASALGRVRAAALIGSQLGQPRHWDGVARLKMMMYWYLALPMACLLFNPLPAFLGFGTRLPRGVAAEWSRWGRSPEWFLTWEPSAERVFSSFQAPLLAYVIEDDDIAPPRAAQAILDRLTSAEASKRELTPDELGLARIGHVGLLKPGPTELIWRELLDFYRQHV